MTAETSAPILAVFTNRRSPRSFDSTHEFAPGELTSLLEAARWAPSAYNAQPWRFVIARRGTELHKKVLDSLIEFNQTWAQHAGALLVSIAETTREDGKEQPTAAYDLGQAVAQLATQAHSEGLYVHQMSGFDAAALTASLGLAERFVPVTVAAIGKLGNGDALPEQIRSMEGAPRERKPLAEIVIAGEL